MSKEPKCPTCRDEGVVEAMNCYPCPKCRPDEFKAWERSAKPSPCEAKPE